MAGQRTIRKADVVLALGMDPTASPNSLNVTGLISAVDLNIGGGGSLAGAWSTFTPVIAASVGSGVVGTGSCRYKKLGRIVLITVNVQITALGTGSQFVTLTLPFPGVPFDLQVLSGREVAVSGKALQGVVSSSLLSVSNYDNTYPAVVGANLILSGVYEAAF